MVDFDASYEYSDILAVPLSSDSDLRLYADAESGTIQLFTQQISTGQYWVQITDMVGNILAESPMRTTEGISTFLLPFSSPASGVYLLAVLTRSLYTWKFRME